MDLQIYVPRLKFGKIVEKSIAETSRSIRQKVERARKQQVRRFSRLKKNRIQTNSQMSARQIEKNCQVPTKALNELKMAVEKMSISARGFHKILKLARTIADLDSRDNIAVKHIFEAIAYYQNRTMSI